MYRNQEPAETLKRQEYIDTQNKLLGPAWRDAYLHRKELSEAEIELLRPLAANLKAQALLDYRNARLPGIQAKSVARQVLPGLLVDDTDI
jgi:hypothetical protein